MLGLGATLGIIGVGLVIVVGGILGLRLHAFLALILAAIVVSLLTPDSTAEWYELGKNQIEISEVRDDSLLMNVGPTQANKLGEQFLLVSREPESGKVTTVGTATISEFTENEKAIAELDWQREI